MKKLIIYSPGAYKKRGHAFDYCKGISEEFYQLGYQVHIFGEDGPLKFPNNINEIRINNSNHLKHKKNVTQKIKWGLNRIKKQKILSHKFIESYLAINDGNVLVMFETFEYFTLASIVKKLSGKYFCIFHDTNFNFNQTSLVAGLYKYLCRIPSRRIIKHSRKTFVHGIEMKKNIVSQMGKEYIHKIEEIPYGAPPPIVNFEINKEEAKKKLSLKKDKKYLLSFGTLRLDKEFLPVINALKETNNWEWIIAGPEGDYAYSEIFELAKKNNITSKIHTYQKFIENRDQRLYFVASELAINLYKPFIRHESGTAQLARTYNKPVVVSGPDDLTNYIKSENIGWVLSNKMKLSQVLDAYDHLNDGDKKIIHDNIYNLASKKSWPSVVKKILSSI